MYPSDPVTTAYLNRFHAIERDAHAEVRRLGRDARRAAKAEIRQPSPPRRRHAWSRRASTVASA